MLYNEALKLNTETGSNYGLVNTYFQLGNWYMNAGQNKSAHDYAVKGMDLAKESGNVVAIKNISGLLGQIYSVSGDYKNALLMRNMEIKMKDSLNSIENINAIAKMNFQYEYEKQKAIDDSAFEKQLAIEQEEKAKQTILKYAFIIGSLMLAIFLVIVFNRLKITNRQKLIIEEARNELEVKNKEITDSIAYAKRIQTAILPSQKLVKEYLPDSFVLYKPKDIVAGDFYWMENSGGIILFAAADCTGHGVPGAMVSVVCHNGLNRSLREYGLTDPGKILDKTREIIIQEFEKSDEEVKDGMDISLCALNLKTRELKWAGANNPIWIINPNRKEWPAMALPFGESLGGVEIKPNKQPIGKYTEHKPFTIHSIKLDQGDTVYVFTDGYQDQFGGEKGKKFKASKMKELLLSLNSRSMEDQRKLIDAAFESWKGNLEQIDDVCMIGVRV